MASKDGTIVVHLPIALLADASAEANEAGMSLDELVAAALGSYLEEDGDDDGDGGDQEGEDGAD